MPPKGPYESIDVTPGVRNTNPVGSWKQLHPTTQKYLSDTHNVSADGSNWMQQPANLREAANRYTLPTLKQMATQGKFNQAGRQAPPVAPKTLNAGQMNGANVASFVGSFMGAGNSGLAGIPTMSMSGQTVNPIPGGGVVDTNKGTVNGKVPAPPRPPMPKQGSAMTDKQMFKVAFLAKCIDEGLTIDGIKLRVKQALYFAKKEAIEKRALDWSTLGLAPLAAAALGIGGSYWAGNQILGPGLHQITKPRLPSKEDLLAEELINEYDKQTENVTREAELTRRRRARDRNISGITRY